MSDKITTFSVPYDKEMVLRVPSGQRVTYSAEDDGIREVTDTFDQFGDSMYATTKLVFSKEAFIAAYNAYIKGGTNE